MPLPYAGLLEQISQTPTSGTNYFGAPYVTARFKTWINNETRLNATNMNELVKFIQDYSKQIGNAVDTFLSPTLEQLVELNAGWKMNTDSTGEIFNDYENNIASGDFSHAGGTNSQATGDISFVFGEGLIAANKYQFVIGSYNNNKTDTLFEIGNGTSDSRSNAFEVCTDGNARLGVTDLDTSSIPSYDPQSEDNNKVVPKGYVDKKNAYLNQEIEELKQLNEWLGSISVTSEQYNNSTTLSQLLTEAVYGFTTDTDPPDGRGPRNGDQITVDITDRTPTDPQYPEIWMYKDPDPKEGEQEEDPTPGKWLFFSSLQQLVNASTTAKGLVQIGQNINVVEGLISVPNATDTVLGVVKLGNNIVNDENNNLILSWTKW